MFVAAHGLCESRCCAVPEVRREKGIKRLLLRSSQDVIPPLDFDHGRERAQGVLHVAEELLRVRRGGDLGLGGGGSSTLSPCILLLLFAGAHDVVVGLGLCPLPAVVFLEGGHGGIAWGGGQEKEGSGGGGGLEGSGSADAVVASAVGRGESC